MLSAEVVHAAQRGWCVFPLKTHEKKPLLKDWPNRATSEIDQLKRWNQEHPQCNWGIATGARSGLFVVDCDGDAGLDWLKGKIDGGEPLPESWAVKTRRGLHLYFSSPSGVTIATSAGRIATGVDIRGEGGYVVAPPSIHPLGTPYSVIDASCPLSPAPSWLLASIQSDSRELKPKASPPRYDVWPEGRRNDGLTRYGGSLRRKGCELPEIEERLLEANIRRCQPPLAESEVRKIAASVCRYEKGGPDPLEQAWQATRFDNAQSRYNQFLALVATLQSQRQGLDIALPLERIAGKFGVHFTSVSQWRKKAVATGILIPTGDYIPHRKAGLYRWSNSN